MPEDISVSTVASVVAAVCGVIQIVYLVCCAWIHRKDEDVQLRCTMWGERRQKDERGLDDWIASVRVNNRGKRAVTVVSLEYASPAFANADIAATWDIEPKTVPAHCVANIPAHVTARYPEVHIPDDISVSCVTADGIVIPVVRDPGALTEDRILGGPDESGNYHRVRRQRSYH